MTSSALPSKHHFGPRSSATPSANTGESTPLRHFAWLGGGMAVAFLVPFVLADRIGLQRDVYYGVYAASVLALFVGWSRDTGQSLHQMCARRWKLAIVLGLIAAGAMAFLATRQDASGPHPAVSPLGGALSGEALCTAPLMGCFSQLFRSCSSSQH